MTAPLIRGPMLGLAAGEASEAYHHIVRAQLAADAVGVEIEPQIVEGIGLIVDALTLAADSAGRAEVERRNRQFRGRRAVPSREGCLA